MPSPTISPPTSKRQETELNPQRWGILAIVCAAVFVTLLDGTIVNIAIPSLAVDLGATTRQLQWIVDSYLLVFTGLLLAAGGLGDKFGRRKSLIIGLAFFGITSAYAGSVDSANELIMGRALMGIGAALIFPATLAILTNAFSDPIERAKAIGAWAAVSGMAVAAGPIAGGWLLENFWWGSVFFINVPISIVVAVAAWRMIPESKEANAPGLDVPGVFLSIAAITALVFSIIEAPEWGWLSINAGIGALVAASLITAFVRWELKTEHPMLPVEIFKNMRFSAASAAITAAFFALFGFIFLITQYFQLVRNYSPLQAGVRVLPVAISIAVASILAPLFVQKFGTTKVVITGLLSFAAGLAWIAFVVDVGTSYYVIVGQMILMGIGLGFTTAPATESIMGSLSVEKAGIGSAVNDTTRELGGTLGVAIIGSVFSSVYINALDDGPTFSQLPPEVQDLTAESVGAARTIAGELGPNANAYLSEVNDAFLTGLSVACYVAAGVAIAGAIFAKKFLPAEG